MEHKRLSCLTAIEVKRTEVDAEQYLSSIHTLGLLNATQHGNSVKSNT